MKIQNIRELERQAITQAVLRYGVSQEVASALGLCLKTLYTRTHLYGLRHGINGWEKTKVKGGDAT